MTVKLKYIGATVEGREGDFLPDVPLADHEAPDQETAEQRVSSGIYRFEEDAKQKAFDKLVAESVFGEEAEVAELSVDPESEVPGTIEETEKEPEG